MPDENVFYLVEYQDSNVFNLSSGWTPADNTPTNLVLSVIAAPSQIRLSWNEGAPDQVGSGFKVYRAIDGGGFALMATLPLTTTQWNDTTAAWGHSYTYRVVEYYDNQESSPAEKMLYLALREEILSLDEGDFTHTFHSTRDQLAVDDFGARGVGRTASQTLGMEADGGRGLTRIGTERLEVADSGARLWFLARSTPETWALSDVVTRLWSLARYGAETLALLDGGRRGITRGVNETLGLQDATLREIERMIAEIFDLAENALRGIGRLAEGALALSDGDVCDILRVAVELLTLADVAPRDIARAVGETLGFTDAMARQLGWVREAAESLGLAAGTRRDVERPAPELLALDAIGPRGINRTVLETLGLTDHAERAWAIVRVVDALLELLDGDIREITLTGGEGFALSVAGPRDISRNATETLSFDDTLARYIARILAESLAFMAERQVGLVREAQEALDLVALLEWLAQWVRPMPEILRLLDTAKLPGGTSGYPLDKEPFDARVVPVLLKRRVRIEDI